MALVEERSNRRRLRRESSGDMVAGFIREEIVRGAMRPGDRLRQDDIASELGVSRIPVREAIITLDREGWVRLESNRGAYVRGLSAQDVLDHYELRGYVLGLVASRAAERATPDDVKELSARLAAMKAAADLDAFAAANDAFLSKLVGAAGSSRLRAALRVTPSILHERFFDVLPDAREAQTAGMSAVLRAVKAGDGAKADKAFRAVLAKHGVAVRDQFAANGVLTDEGR